MPDCLYLSRLPRLVSLTRLCLRGLCLWHGGWQSIVGVIQHLSARSQTAKLALYVHFRRVLVGSFAFAVAWVIFSVVRSSEVEEVSERVLSEICCCQCLSLGAVTYAPLRYFLFSSAILVVTLGE